MVKITTVCLLNFSYYKCHVLNFRQNDIELDIPDKNEKKIMEKEEMKKEKRTSKLSKAEKKRRQKEDNQSKKKQTKGITKV